jgi:hypothetical protein
MAHPLKTINHAISLRKRGMGVPSIATLRYIQKHCFKLVKER